MPCELRNCHQLAESACVTICDRTCPRRQFQTSYKNYGPGKGKKYQSVFLVVKITYLNIFKNYGAAELTVELIILQYT